MSGVVRCASKDPSFGGEVSQGVKLNVPGGTVAVADSAIFWLLILKTG